MEILVTSATGTIGSQVAHMLVQLGHRVRAMSRDPGRLTVAGVEPVVADFDNQASLVAALTHVDAVFLATGGSASSQEHPGAAIGRHDLALISAAERTGVSRVVKLSAFGTGTTTSPPLGNWHSTGEDRLRASDISWTILRPVGFASNAKRWFPPGVSSGTVHSPTGDGKQGIVDPRDVAAVAVCALTSSEHQGKTYTLTGPELLSVSDQVAALSSLLSRPIRVIEDSPSETRQALLHSGMSAQAVDFMMAGIEFVRAGRCELLTEDVKLITGRAPIRFEHWLRDNLRIFQTS